jgi:hypothetical protein
MAFRLLPTWHYSMISSIFNRLFICDSNPSMSKDQILPKHSSTIHGCTRVQWTRGQLSEQLHKSKQAHTNPCAWNTKIKFCPKRPEIMILTISTHPSHLSFPAVIWKMRIWLLKLVWVCTLPSLACRGSFNWEAFNCFHGNHNHLGALLGCRFHSLILNPSKGWGWRQILRR